MATPKKFTGVSTKTLNEVLDSQTVRAALRARGARVLPRAKAIAFSNNTPDFANALNLTEGTRPGTGAKDGLRRSYVRIGAVLTDGMDAGTGRAKLTHREILRRGAHGS